MLRVSTEGSLIKNFHGWPKAARNGKICKIFEKGEINNTASIFFSGSHSVFSLGRIDNLTKNFGVKILKGVSPRAVITTKCFSKILLSNFLVAMSGVYTLAEGIALDIENKFSFEDAGC